MNTSKLVKDFGFENLKELADLYGCSSQHIRDCHAAAKETGCNKFKIILLGATCLKHKIETDDKVNLINMINLMEW